MKKIVFLPLVAALTLFSACGGKKVNCTADPDQVFGVHYTAADVKVWNVLGGSAATNVFAALPVIEGAHYAPAGDYIIASTTDTAAIGEAARALCRDMRVDYHSLTPVWVSLSTQDTMASLFFLYGQTADDGTELPVMDLSSTVSASVEVARNGYTQVAIQLADSVRWAELTRENIGHSLAITLGNRLLTAPRVMSEITGGRMSIAVGSSFSDDDYCALATILNRHE